LPIAEEKMYLLFQPVRLPSGPGSLSAQNQLTVWPPHAGICCWVPTCPLEMPLSLTIDEGKKYWHKIGQRKGEKENTKAAREGRIPWGWPKILQSQWPPAAFRQWAQKKGTDPICSVSPCWVSPSEKMSLLK